MGAGQFLPCDGCQNGTSDGVEVETLVANNLNEDSRWAMGQSWQEAHRRQVASAEDALFGADGRGGESSSQLCDRSARRRAVGDSWPRRLSRTLLGVQLAGELESENVARQSRNGLFCGLRVSYRRLLRGAQLRDRPSDVRDSRVIVSKVNESDAGRQFCTNNCVALIDPGGNRL